MSQFIDFTLPSTVPGRTLHAFRCVPEGEVRAVLQLSHGMVEFIDRYKGLTDALLDNERMFGFCYTQLYDIEQEQNGLYYYDRSPKFDPELFRRINSRKAAIED